MQEVVDHVKINNYPPSIIKARRRHNQSYRCHNQRSVPTIKRRLATTIGLGPNFSLKSNVAPHKSHVNQSSAAKKGRNNQSSAAKRSQQSKLGRKKRSQQSKVRAVATIKGARPTIKGGAVNNQRCGEQLPREFDFHRGRESRLEDSRLFAGVESFEAWSTGVRPNCTESGQTGLTSRTKISFIRS